MDCIHSFRESITINSNPMRISNPATKMFFFYLSTDCFIPANFQYVASLCSSPRLETSCALRGDNSYRDLAASELCAEVELVLVLVAAISSLYAVFRVPWSRGILISITSLTLFPVSWLRIWSLYLLTQYFLHYNLLKDVSKLLMFL
jgi:hypothetical protein